MQIFSSNRAAKCSRARKQFLFSIFRVILIIVASLALPFLIKAIPGLASNNLKQIDSEPRGIYQLAAGEQSKFAKNIEDGSTVIIDLTHTLNSKNPYWPGKDNKPFHLEYFTSIAQDGSLEGRIRLDEHTGTHIDSPNHFFADQISLEKISAERLIVPAVVIDITRNVADEDDYALSLQDVKDWEK